ncbi:MAG: tetratricopeptide repeat protein [Bacteroidetes bacterium]|nr:tetratricopeptide repeat protein [Bacteroidota bacterium]
MTAKFCPHCGAENTGEFKFCPNCGSQFPETTDNVQPEKQERQVEKPQDTDKVLRCPTCGFINAVDARACDSCGTFLGGAEKEIVENPPPPRHAERAAMENDAARKRTPEAKGKKKGPKHPTEQKTETRKRFHLEPYQSAAIVAALLLGGILVYGLMSSKPTSSAGGGGNAPSQQSTSTGQPSPEVLQEIDRLREVVSKQPDDLGSLLRLSNMLQDNGFYDQAAIYYKRYLNDVPKNVDARVDYGVTLFEGGHTVEAITQIKDALKIDPKHQIGLFNLGIIYLNSGEFNKADSAFKRCVEVNPNSEIGKKAKQTLEQHANITSQEVN